jgi:CHASE3 domain sensor protein
MRSLTLTLLLLLLLLLLQASLYDVNALTDQAKQYNSETKIALEIATLSVSF